MQQEKEYRTIDLLKLAEGLLKRAWAIALSVMLCGILAFLHAALFITPLYESQILFYVNNSSISLGSTSVSITPSEISAAKSLVDTYIVILETRMTLNDVISVGGLDRSYTELKRMIEAGALNDTEVFSVSVTSDDPREAEHIANTIGTVLPDKIANIVDGSSVRIVDYAVVPSTQKSPDIGRNTILGLMIGLVLSCAVICVIEVLDDQIHSEDYLIQNYGNIPLLSVIPDMLEEKPQNNYYYNRYGGYYSQAASRPRPKRTGASHASSAGKEAKK